MTSESLAAMLGWASVINITTLLLSTLSLVAMRETITRTHSRLSSLDEKDLGRAYF